MWRIREIVFNGDTSFVFENKATKSIQIYSVQHFFRKKPAWWHKLSSEDLMTIGYFLSEDREIKIKLKNLLKNK